MEQAVTAKVKLAESCEELDRTIESFSRAVQHCIDTAWNNNLHSKKEIRESCYYEIREEYSLHSQLAVTAIDQTYEMIQEAGSKPEVSDRLSIRYNFPRSASVSGDWTELSLATLNGRKKFNIQIPECYQQYLDAEVCESNLIHEDGAYYFCFVFAIQVEEPSVRRDSRVLGVDLGVNKTAVTSDGSFYGTEIKKKRKQRDNLVAEIQSKGTHEAHNLLQRIGSRWKRFTDWKNHNISRKIVDSVEPGDVIVMEDLTHIRETNDNATEWVHKWSFRDLQDKIEYKAHLKGVRVVYINPENTSNECSNCSHVDSDSRHGGFYRCVNCGFTLDADLNAARNIARRYTRNTGQAGRPVNRPNDSGNYEADVARTFEAENTRKPLPHEATA